MAKKPQKARPAQSTAPSTMGDQLRPRPAPDAGQPPRERKD